MEELIARLNHEDASIPADSEGCINTINRACI